MPLSITVFFMPVYSSYIHLYLFLSPVYSPLSLSISLLIQIQAYFFQSRFIYLCLFFVCPPIFFSLSCHSTSISFYLFVNPNSRMPLSITVFFMPVYSSYIHLYLFLSLVYPPLSLSISLLIQIHGYLFQSCFLHLSLILIYPLVSILISFLFTTISFYLLFIQICIYLLQSPSSNLCLSLVYSPLSLSIFLPFQIHCYIFQCSSLYFNISLIYSPLLLSISCISLCQSRFTLISFNPCPSS